VRTSGPSARVAPACSGHAVLSASLDGTVRAFDLVRYRNFRTLTTPTPVQFISLACDPAGEVSGHARLAGPGAAPATPHTCNPSGATG
jgi:hypothetical protein